MPVIKAANLTQWGIPLSTPAAHDKRHNLNNCQSNLRLSELRKLTLKGGGMQISSSGLPLSPVWRLTVLAMVFLQDTVEITPCFFF